MLLLSYLNPNGYVSTILAQISNLTFSEYPFDGGCAVLCRQTDGQIIAAALQTPQNGGQIFKKYFSSFFC